jgi:hypothetical protein
MINLRVGKYYKTRGGDIVQVVFAGSVSKPFSYSIASHTVYLYVGGHVNPSKEPHPGDLVEEYIPESTKSSIPNGFIEVIDSVNKRRTLVNAEYIIEIAEHHWGVRIMYSGEKFFQTEESYPDILNKIHNAQKVTK